MNRFASRCPRSWTLVLALLAGCSGPAPGLSPEEALKTFQIEEGFEIELFAAEPLVVDPVAMDVDELGRIWVVEMPGYPMDLARTGRVKLLEDTDGDGKPETSTLFADHLRMPTGILRWKEGVLVTDAPDVLYLEDSDNDGQADVREIVLTGFAFSNPQHLVNTPLYGLDNWIYLAHESAVTAVIFKDRFGDGGSRIVFPDHPGTPSLNVNADGRNVRFRPDTYELEVLSGTSQYGHTFDEWGRHFVLNNSNHVRHEVVATRYLKRNRSLLVPSVMQDLSDHGNAAQVFSITKNPEHAMLTDVGELTSACSLTLYLGGAFPAGFERISFVAEPVHNLVHVDRWIDTGPTFVARRWLENREFLASTDSWFRPVNFYIGPDGALYLLDYYRRSIEHPEWMDDHYHGPGRGPQFLYEGSDRGRIYRIVPKGSLKYAGDIDLLEANDQELVAYLESPNIWWRRTAQRLLLDRARKSAAEPLIRIFRESRSPLARVHALWTLDGLGFLEESLIETALKDESAGIRENAIRLAEPRLSSSPALRSALLDMNSDSDPKVRFQLLCTLGDIDSREAEILRNELLWQDLESDWVQVAALTAASVDAGQLLNDAVTRLAKQPSPPAASFFRRLGSLVAVSRNVPAVGSLLRAAGSESSEDSWWKAAALEGLAEGVRAGGGDLSELQISTGQLASLAEAENAPVRKAALDLLEACGSTHQDNVAGILTRAWQKATDRAVDPARRADALRLIMLADSDPNRRVLEKLIEPREPEEVQLASASALARTRDMEATRFFLKNWKSFTPAVRNQIAVEMLKNEAQVRQLLEAVSDGEIPPWTLSWSQRLRLVMYPAPEIRERARRLLNGTDREREQVVEHYLKALEIAGDPGRGRQVFVKNCSSCHQMGGEGGELGPDLGTVRNRDGEFLLREILTPSRSIAQNFQMYILELADGRQIEGIIVEQTSNSITLRRAEGTAERAEIHESVVPREQIRTMRVSTISAMPQDLDQQIGIQDMADLLSFLTR